MFVNSVSISNNFLHSNSLYQKRQVNTFSKPHKTDQVSFSGGLNPEMLKNQLRILLTQDIWAEKLSVKMPETRLEKEVLLEVLQNRLKLDRFARLSNERATIKGDISYLNDLLEKDPLNPNIPKLRQELVRRGNIESVLKTLDKQIDMEGKKNKPALDYFKNIEKIEEEYIDKRLVRFPQMEKFWFKIKRNNINKNGQYSTKELIDIIAEDKAPVAVSKNIAKPLSKKDLMVKAEKEYEQYLRENIDIYESRMNHNDDARNGRKFVQELNMATIKKYPGIEKSLQKMYESVESRYSHKINRLVDIDIYPIGEIWNDMRLVETDMKKVIKDIVFIKQQLKTCPDNKVFNETLKAWEKTLEELKQDWIKGMKYSLKYEDMNRQRFSDAGRLSEYEYLAGENKTIKKHKAALELYRKNNDNIPDESWANILS